MKLHIREISKAIADKVNEQKGKIILVGCPIHNGITTVLNLTTCLANESAGMKTTLIADTGEELPDEQISSYGVDSKFFSGEVYSEPLQSRSAVDPNKRLLDVTLEKITKNGGPDNVLIDFCTVGGLFQYGLFQYGDENEFLVTSKVIEEFLAKGRNIVVSFYPLHLAIAMSENKHGKPMPEGYDNLPFHVVNGTPEFKTLLKNIPSSIKDKVSDYFIWAKDTEAAGAQVTF